MGPRVAVAASGGRDSTALLHATARAARAIGVEVLALHVHHGLMPQADAWWRHLQRQCARWARGGLPVRFIGHRIDGRPAPGESVEAWARRERYAALTRMARAHRAGVVLLAHHRRDQAETVLLQALRGAGPAGLAAMPVDAERDGLCWARPWLNQPRARIEAYVRRFRLSFVDDASNTDRRHARSRLRRAVWRAMERDFPHAETALAHVARRAHEAAQCASALAAIDLAGCVAVDGDTTELAVVPWLTLDEARRANALRHWLHAVLPAGPTDALVTRLVQELVTACTGARWPASGAQLRLQRGRLRVAIPAPVRTGSSIAIDLSASGEHDVPEWGGAFVVAESAVGGLPVRLLVRAELRARGGGETFQRAPKSVPRSLKKAYQAAGLGTDERTGPLVWAEGRLLFVPGLGIDARVLAGPGEPARCLAWRPTS